MKFILALFLLALSSQASAVINGDKLSDDEIPPVGKYGAACSAVLIGPKVIVTAAHCVESFPLSFKIRGKFYEATVTPDPNFNNKADDTQNDMSLPRDIAYGILNNPVIGVTPASVTKIIPQKNDRILFAGLGMPNYDREYGIAKVAVITSRSVTVRGFGERPQTVSEADSGGPNFIIGDDGNLLLFAVTSDGTGVSDMRKELKDKNALPYTSGTSKIFSGTPRSARSFIEDFAEANSVEICGLNKVCKAISIPKTIK